MNRRLRSIIRSRRYEMQTAAAAICISLLGGWTASGQPLYSFETDLQGWGATGFGSSDFISVATSTMGATDGLQSMAVETGPTFGWDVNISLGPDDSTGAYDAFNAAASNLNEFTLDFDVSITNDSFANVSNPGNFFLINVAANSDSPNFPQQFNVTPNLAGTTGTFPVSIPMTSLPVAQDSSFYQLNIGSNSDHENGGGGEGVTYFVDNIRFTQLPETIEETLFSFETPDDLGTPDVNEQFENWTEGFGTGHQHSISSLGVTDGSSALQIDRQSQTSPNFSWGSQFVLASDIDPDPDVQEIDPVIQARIDDLIEKINGAFAIAFDVRFDDAFPNTPTFTKFGIHFSDEDDTFFQAEGDSFNGAPAIGDTGTVTIPFSAMEDFGNGPILADVGLVEGSDFLRIGISTNTDGAGVYQIDNIRLISFAGDAADLDGDGDVDGDDLLAIQQIDPALIATWQGEYGNGFGSAAAAVAVPETASLVLALCASMAWFGRSWSR